MEEISFRPEIRTVTMSTETDTEQLELLETLIPLGII